MTPATFFGIDLAWSDRHRTGLCAVDASGRVVDERLAATDDEIVSWVADRLDGPAVIGVDAPLLVPNETRRRPCEGELHRAYGTRKAGAHPANRRLFLDRDGRIRGEDLAAHFAALGFADPWAAENRAILEVYPHPALIEAFGLAERLLYKAKPGIGPEGRRVGLRNLARLVAALGDADPPLTGDPVDVPDSARGRELKAIEDRLDARVCAWIASVWGRHGEERIRLFGDAASGHVAVPVGRFVDVPVRIDPVPRRAG